MKDARFTELVNLYIDRQISPDETAELEAELQSSPRRRQIYQQYCRMHRATKLVYESFRTPVDQGAEAPAGSSTIARFENRKRAAQRLRWAYGLGGLAAAACVAFALVRSGTFPSNRTQALVQDQQSKVPAVASVTSKPAAQQSSTAAPARTEVSATQQDYAAMLAAMREDQKTFAIKSLFDDGVFDGKQAQPADGRRVFQNKTRQDGKSAEFSAYQFQR